MYLDYFSLKRHPFRITPDPSLFFPGGAHGRGVVLDALVYAITSGEGILKVVGEVGSGKTMLCRMLEERLPSSVEIVYLANPNLSARDIIYAIAFELKLEVDAGTDRLVVMHKLQNYLLQRHSLGASVVVFIEEAQSMPLETLEEVRLLSNLETHRHKLMQIVLFGQPELDRKLQDKSIRQLRERITHSFNLEPLTEDEVREYLHFRLQTAGCPWPQLFSLKSEKMLAKASEGLTRRINILADKALLASYADPGARQEPRSSSGEILPMVLPRHVRTAIADSAYGSRLSEKYLPYSGYALAAVTLAVLIFVLFKYVWSDEGNEVAGVTPAVASVLLQSTNTRQAVAAFQDNLASPSALVVDVAEENPSAELAPAGAANAMTDDTQYARIEAAEPEEIEVADSAFTSVSANPAATVMAGPSAVAGNPEITIGSEPGAGPISSSGDVTHVIDNQDAETIASAASLSPALPSQQAVAVLPAASQQAVPFLFSGLAVARAGASAEWLASLANKIGYTIQLFSALTRQPEQLNGFLALLDRSMMLDRVYLCVISGNDTRPEQWLVLYNEFATLSEAQTRIESFPSAVSQYSPYTRNLNDIECAN